MIFSQYEDSYLIYLAKEHNEKAFKVLFDKYQIISNSIIRKFNFSSVDKEEFLLDSYSIFLKCIQIYKASYKFYNLYTVSFKRMLIKKINKVKPYLYLEEVLYCQPNSKSEYSYCACDVLFENNLQREIYDLIRKGYSYQEVSIKLDISIKNVYYQVRRIKDLTQKSLKIRN